MDDLIARENSLPGNSYLEWGIDGAGDPGIQGFTTEISVNRGETARLKIKSDATAYRVDIDRIGYYDGAGARRVATVVPQIPLPQKQPEPLHAPSPGLVDCGNWEVSASWDVPANATS